MHWAFFAAISVFGSGLYNFLLTASKRTIPDGVYYKHMYLCSILALAGALSGLMLVWYRFNRATEFELFKHSVKVPQVAVPACLLCAYMLTNLLALTGGGTVAIGIINLNMFVALTLGILFLGNKVNQKVVIAALVAGVSMIYAANETARIN